MDRQLITQRLQELHAEAATGQKVLADLDAKRVGVQNTLLRIAGAVQVLEELLAASPETPSPPQADHDD